MEIRTSTVAVIAASCITVGAAGAFIASRPARAPQTAAPVADVATGGVEQSEAVVSDADTPVAPADGSPVKAAPAAPEVAPRASARPDAARTAPAAPRTSRPASASSAPPPTRESSPPRAAQEARASAPEVRLPAPSAPEPRPVQPVATVAPAAPAAPAETFEPAEPKGPPAPRFVDLVVSTDSVLGLQIETALTSEKARVEDEVVARVTRDVRVGDRVAIPAGAQARGEVTMVERGGKLKDKARLGIRFTSVVLADGTRIPLETDTIYREGDSPGGESTAKIGGGAIGGAILGGIFGGAKGAAIGAATGAGAGTAAVVAGGRNAATLPSGTPVTVRLIKPATVTVEE